MSTQDTPPPGKVPMTPQFALACVIVSVIGILIFAVMALLGLRLHLRLTPFLGVCLEILSIACLIDSVKKRRIILQGGKVFVPTSPDIHIQRTQMTISVVFLLLLDIAFAVYVFWTCYFDRQSYDVFFWWEAAFFWAVWIGIYFLADSKHLLLWSSLPEAEGRMATYPNDSLPPLTVRALTRPTLSMIGFGLVMGCGLGLPYFWSGSHLWIGRLLLALCGGLASGGVLALLYIVLVAVLRAWNARVARAAMQSKGVPAGLVWPPPPQVPHEETKEEVGR